MLCLSKSLLLTLFHTGRSVVWVTVTVTITPLYIRWLENISYWILPWKRHGRHALNTSIISSIRNGATFNSTYSILSFILLISNYFHSLSMKIILQPVNHLIQSFVIIPLNNSWYSRTLIILTIWFVQVFLNIHSTDPLHDRPTF